MNRNANSRFALAPSVNIPRTKMNRPFNNSLTFDCGMLVPFYFSEVLPGSTHKVSTHKVVRTQPMVSAPMQDLFLDTYYFFVPWRLVWSHWKEFMGENTSSPWVPSTEYTIPQTGVFPDVAMSIKDTTGLKNTLWDYFGMPLKDFSNSTENVTMSSLYLRAYALIVREFFQSEAVETPLNVPLNDNNTFLPNYYSEVNTVFGNGIYIVNKFHDYFSSALPTPLKGTDVFAFPRTPVLPTEDQIPADTIKTRFPDLYPMTGTSFTGTQPDRPVYSFINTDKANVNNTPKFNLPGIAGAYVPTNLWTAIDVSIEQLRYAFAIQRLLERDAIGGTRYREILRAHFGTVSPDASQQIPQYLGGNRKMLNISQILQTSETDQTPLGSVGGYSLTNDSHYDFESSFTEHGVILGLMCVRYKHRYSQGIKRALSRKTRYDFYWPEFAFLGNNQAILKKEIYADGTAADNDVFGYQEYASDYRYNPDMVVGEFRPEINTGLKSWTFADVYDTHPTLSREWLKEDKTNLDRVLAVSSSVANQLWANIEVDEKVILPMPLYSLPNIMSQF